MNESAVRKTGVFRPIHVSRRVSETVQDRSKVASDETYKLSPMILISDNVRFMACGCDIRGDFLEGASKDCEVVNHGYFQ